MPPSIGKYLCSTACLRHVFALGVLAVLGGVLLFSLESDQPLAPVRIGVIHSLSGTMAGSERPLVDAVRLAVEEVNASGGIQGRPLSMVVADCHSDAAFCASEAERLIVQEQVSALFGCWTSACRKAVKPVVEAHRHLLVYPVQYEGLEQSPNILYTGSVANQQIIPGIRWAASHFGGRLFLLGSDYIFPRTANRLIGDLLEATGGEVLAEHYLPLGAQDMTAVIEQIKAQGPDVLVNTLNGDSNAALFMALVANGLASLPVVSFSVSEAEMGGWGGGRLQAHYVVWSYFQTINQPANQAFVRAWQARYGDAGRISDPAEAAYVGVWLWAQAAREAGEITPARLDHALVRQTLNAPGGLVAVDRGTRHVWKMVRIGQVEPEGRFREVWTSHRPVAPMPFPSYRSREDWLRISRALEAGS